jgi:hypothetical protein
MFDELCSPRLDGVSAQTFHARGRAPLWAARLGCIRVWQQEFLRFLYGRKYNPAQPREPAGTPVGGRFAGGLGSISSYPKVAFAGPALRGAQAALTLFTGLLTQESSGRRPIMEFNAKEFAPGEGLELETRAVRNLDRDEVSSVCL